MPALIAFSCLRLDDEAIDDRVHVRRTSSGSSSSTSLGDVDGLPSTISRRQPFLRTSVKTKSRSSP